ncbi:MAG: single-stranded-DNA-specific exonuclease RecJ [Planctomycetes bacterium]|nr:single-stranded-DNA-specific exonuclease RecJ [Planctomycetota bacterium]
MDTAILPSQYSWHFLSGDSAKSRALAEELTLPPLMTQVLLNRGFSTADTISALFKSSLHELPDPSLLPDYQQARDAIFRARDEKYPVIIYGDYDADGLCGTALLMRLLKHIGVDAIPFIPDRMADGYSLGPNTMKLVDKHQAKLVITVDNGTSAVAELGELADAGIEVVVVDHHMAGDELPRCTALMNPWLLPKNKDGEYPYFVEFCGAAVAFILAWGILREHHQQDKLDNKFREFLSDLMCYASIATISDMMPLRGPNRALVINGLARMPHSRFPGINALAKTAMRNNDQLLAGDIGFGIAPRINAAGRLFKADVALQALLADDVPSAQRWVAQLSELNEERKLVTVEQANKLMGEAQRQHQRGDSVVFVGSSEAHFGVLGIAAANICESTGLPTFCWAECTPGVARGSARAPRGQSVAKILNSSAQLFNKHGGHAAAAGFEFDPANAELISKALNAAATSNGKVGKPQLDIDVEVSPGELSVNLLKRMAQLEPFGQKFKEPVYLCSNVTLASAPRIVGKNQNVMQFTFERDGVIEKGILFKLQERYKQLTAGDTIDVVFTANLNHFAGRTNAQWLVKDFRSSK